MGWVFVCIVKCEGGGEGINTMSKAMSKTLTKTMTKTKGESVSVKEKLKVEVWEEMQ